MTPRWPVIALSGATTDSAAWQQAKDVGRATRVTLPVSKDNVVFGCAGGVEERLCKPGELSLATAVRGVDEGPLFQQGRPEIWAVQDWLSSCSTRPSCVRPVMRSSL